MDIIDNIYDKLVGNSDKNCNGLKFRPFNLKCHCTKNFQLGQKIILPNGQKSWVTSIKWQFRGGYTLSCAGKDTRVLCASARRSQSAKVKDLAYTKINTEIAKLNADIDEKINSVNENISDKNEEQSNSVSYVNKRVDTCEGRLDNIESQLSEILKKLNGG